LNAPVSAEITGYACSTFAYLYSLTGDQSYLKAAVRSAHYLVKEGWDAQSSTFPFEQGSGLAYFFDLGIMIRGLLAVWRITAEEPLRERALEASLSLAFDFLGEEGFHPVISLPEKQPLAQENRWSRQPGCYQLKSALAWWDVAEACRRPDAMKMFNAAVGAMIERHEDFPEGAGMVPDREKIMDRLHAYCYFLEALLFAADREKAREALTDGVARAALLLREIRPRFERSDVNAQLLRVRLIAHRLGILPLDETAARDEAERLAGFQIVEGSQGSPPAQNPCYRGGFYFGRKDGQMLPFVNPVSAAFGLQALRLWHDHQSGQWTFQLHQLI
jgi:hypothetical protein